MKAWYKLLGEIERKIGSYTAKKWLYCLKVIKFDACNLYLEAESHFQAQWFEEHIRPVIKSGFYNENFHPIKVHLSISNMSKKPIFKQEKKEYIFKSNPLDTYSTFAYFLASEKNLMTLKILREATKQNFEFNPIFLYGSKGSGKTHLLQALAHKFKDQNLKVFYVNAKNFTSHVVEAIRTGTMQNFRKAYRSLDVLIIDDIQVFSKKFATQEEFFNTFNALHTDNKKIILSANAPANTFKEIEPRLISRFEWGISLYLEKLSDFKLILKNQLQMLNLKLNTEIEKFLLSSFKNINSLKKALQTLALNAHLEKKENLELNQVKYYLYSLLKEENESKLTSEKIISATSSYYGITINDILGKSQTRECALPRHFSMYLCREILKMPYMKIGKYFKRDHSTVMTSVKSIKKQLEAKDRATYLALNQISKKIENL